MQLRATGAATIPAPGRACLTHTHKHTHARAHTPAGPSPRSHPTANRCPFPDLFRGGRPRWAHFFFSGQEPQHRDRSSIFRSNRCRGWGRGKTDERAFELKSRERERERERERFETMGNVKSKQAGPSKKALTSCYKDCTALVKERKCAPILVRLAWWVVNRFWGLRMPFR